MKIIPAKTPKGVKLLFPKYTWDYYKKKEKKIYLTFDDGPIPEITEFVLNQLELFNAKATFFCIGDNIKKHPTIFKKIIIAEHSIGNHTTNHLKDKNSSLSDYIENVQECQKNINQYTKTTKKLFRPPYGQLNKSKLAVLQKLGYQIILWDVLSKDWDTKISPKQCLQYVVRNAKSGSIVVFHDSIKASRNLEATLPQVLKHFSEKGYVFDAI